MSSKLRTRGTGANRARNFTSRMEMLVSILSEKGIKIVPGNSPATDCKGTIFMPWLKDDATEEDFLKFFVNAAHEQAHFHGKSDASKMPKEKLKHFCINAVDDIRCERLQEIAYPGLVGYRKSEYKLDCKGWVKKEFESASAENIQPLIISMMKYMIIKVRVQQMDAVDDIPIPASDDLKEYYAKYLEDAERTLDEIETFKESMEIGELLYKRIKDLITDEMTPPEPEKGEGEEGEPSDGKGKGKKSDKPEDDKSDEDKSDEDKSEEGDDGDDGDDAPESSSKADDTEEPDADDKDGGSSSEDGDKEKEEEDRKAAEKAKEELEKKVEEAMADMDGAEDGYKTIADKYRDDVAGKAKEYEGEYSVRNGVRDRVYFQYPNLTKGFKTLKAGKSLLGSIGSRMTKLFVAQTRERFVYNQRKGRFDMKSFISDPMDKRMDVYSKVIPGSLDKAAVCFAVDNSGSMSGARIEKAYKILAALLYYLDKAGVPTEAIGFTAESTHSSAAYRTGAVRHTIIKTYEETFNKKSISRCYAPRDLEQNVELEALRYLAPRLNQRPEGKKVMFVLSDGAPAFSGGIMDIRMAEAYKKYIIRLREMGMYVVGFGIDCCVSEYFGEHSINTSTSNLGEAIVKQLTEILNRR